LSVDVVSVFFALELNVQQMIVFLNVVIFAKQGAHTIKVIHPEILPPLHVERFCAIKTIKRSPPFLLNDSTVVLLQFILSDFREIYSYITFDCYVYFEVQLAATYS